MYETIINLNCNFFYILPLNINIKNDPQERKNDPLVLFN
jgi:hypothetical protein